MRKLNILVATWVVASAIGTQDPHARADVSEPVVRDSGHATAAVPRLVPTAPPAPEVVSTPPEDPRSEAELMVTLCLSEASFGETDCAILTHIRARYARRHDISLREALIRLHGQPRRGVPYPGLRPDRATNPQDWDRRPWLGDIHEDLREPVGWALNPRNGAWDRAEQQALQRLFTVVRGVIGGEVRDPCRGGVRPSIWGGPAVDSDLITQRLAQGWEIARCMPVPLNTYLGKSSRRPAVVTTAQL